MISMQRTFRLTLNSTYSRFLVITCCLALLCSGCSGLAGNTTASRSATSTASRNGSSTISQTVAPKSDAHGFTTEEVQRMRLTKVQAMIQGMTLDQKLGQLIIVEYLGKSYQGSGLQEMVAQQFVGGFMYQESNHNFDPPYNIASNVDGISIQAMKDAHIPLMIATDQEGGLVNRLYKFHGYLPSAQAMAASGNNQMALDQGTMAAKWLAQLGINTDLAPVVDVHTVDPPVLASRMFGRDPQTVVKYAGAYLDGLQQNGVIGCLKHFPGLGAVTSDPHAGLPMVGRSKAGLESIDLAPYRVMIQQNHPGMIMATDVLMPAIDPTLPAELSPKAIDGVLRGELGYDGVVITDGLYMGGISERWSLSQASVLAIMAGSDLVEGPFTPAQVASIVAALKEAIQQGKLSVDRIDQSLQRILLMKMQYGIIK